MARDLVVARKDDQEEVGEVLKEGEVQVVQQRVRFHWGLVEDDQEEGESWVEVVGTLSIQNFLAY